MYIHTRTEGRRVVLFFFLLFRSRVLRLLLTLPHLYRSSRVSLQFVLLLSLRSLVLSFASLCSSPQPSFLLLLLSLPLSVCL